MPSDEQRAARFGPLFSTGLVGLIALIGGLTPVAARDAMIQLPTYSTGLLRFGTAAVLLFVTHRLLPRRDPRERVPIGRHDWPRFALAAALCVPLNQICFLGGVKLASASHAGLFYGLTPVLVYVFTLVIGRAKLSARMSAAALLAFLGAATLSWEGLQFGDNRSFFLGDVLLFGAVATWAGYSVVSVPLVERYGALRSLVIVFGVGVLMYLPAWFVDGNRFDLTAVSWRARAGFAFITLITCYVNYFLWFTALARIDVNRLAVGVNTAPLVAVIAAYFWLNEPIGALLILGAALLLTAITLANWDKLRNKRT